MLDYQFVTCLPIDTYFTWQVHLWLENLKELGYSGKATVLLFQPLNREWNNKWDQIIALYPETEFKVYKDDGSIQPLLGIYIPVLRPYLMKKYLEEFPEMENKTIIYYDSDVLFTPDFKLNELLEDNVTYISDAKSYMNVSYFESKTRDVLPEKLEEYKKIDVIEDLANIVGIDKQIIIDNNNNTGGVQYIFKGTTKEFWEKVQKDVINMRTYLLHINRKYFKNESAGIQSWASDLWAVLYNLWYYNKEVKVVKEMDFAWASDPIGKLEKVGIFHNAGIVGDTFNGVPSFYKGKYHTGISPINDPHLKEILESEESKKYCTWWYTNKLWELHEKYHLNY